MGGRAASILRKGTMQPINKLSSGNIPNPLAFIPRKGIASPKNVDLLSKNNEGSVKRNLHGDGGHGNLKWLYEVITCLELSIKEPNSKSNIQKF